jgi:hypothetical protein
MKINKLLEQHPLSTEIIRKWFFNQMLASIEVAQEVPEEFKEAMLKEGVTNERLAILIEAQPRSLFDCFDENNIIIIIKYHDNFGFTYSVEEADENNFFKNRKDAELEAIDIAFEILEEQLTPIKLPKLEE